jgi:hypothetical protein
MAHILKRRTPSPEVPFELYPDLVWTVLLKVPVPPNSGPLLPFLVSRLPVTVSTPGVYSFLQGYFLQGYPERLRIRETVL